MSNKKWLLFIIPKVYPCITGGLEVFNYHLINELARYYQVHALTYCKHINAPKIDIHPLKWMKFVKLTQPILIFIFVFKNRKKIGLVQLSYAKSYWTLWFAYVILNKMFGVKYGFTIHGGGLTEWKPRWVHKLFFKNAEFITGVSERILIEYGIRSGRNIIYSPPLIPFKVLSTGKVKRSDWGYTNNDLILLYVGSLKPLKSVDTLIEALGILPKEILKKYKLKVLIAGDGVSKEELSRRSSELGLEKIINFVGLVERDKVPELYNIANIYTICSEYEGLPISLLEAFANGLPSITSDAPGLVDLSKENNNSLLFKTKDKKDYAKKIELIICNDTLKDELGKNSLQYYNNHFSYNRLIMDFKKLIDDSE